MTETEARDNPSLVLQKMHMWRMAFFGLVILLAGIVIGGASAFVVVRRTRMDRPLSPTIAITGMMPRLQRDLDLSPEQEEKLKPILQEHMERLREIRVNAGQEISEELQLMQEEISSVLDERQKEFWQRNLQRLQDDLHRGFRGPGGRGDRFRGGRERFEPPPGPPWGERRRRGGQQQR